MSKIEVAVLDVPPPDLPSPAEPELETQLKETWRMADLPVMVGGTTPPSISPFEVTEPTGTTPPPSPQNEPPSKK